MSCRHFAPLRLLLWLTLCAASLSALVQGATAPGTRTLPSPHSFDTLVSRVEAAIVAQKMGLVAQASASRGAAARGVKIPGNAVLMVFRNDYAVRMLQASVPAGIEAPLRLYVTENADGTASLSWRPPSAVFAPYNNPAIDEMARELDPIVARIARDAVGS
jgi:uncharacterized protein (DUF302 family)